MVPLAFLVGVLRSRLARSGVGDLLLALGRGTPIRDALAGALADPTLEIAYWLPEQARYVSAEGKPLPEQPDGRGDDARRARGPADGCAPARPDCSPTSRSSSTRSPRPPGSGSTTSGSRRSCARRSRSSRRSSTPLRRCSARSTATARIANLNDAAWQRERLRRGERRQGPAVLGRLRRPGGASEARRRFEEAAPAHEAASFEHTFVNQLGERLTIAWSTAPLYEEDGSVRYVVCGGLDITERERQHRAAPGQRGAPAGRDRRVAGRDRRVRPRRHDHPLEPGCGADLRLDGRAGGRREGQAPAAGSRSGAGRALSPRPRRRGLHGRREHEGAQRRVVRQRRDRRSADPRLGRAT